MNNKNLTIRIELSRRQTIVFIAAALLCLTPGDTVTEQLTLTTYYPSPYGVYEDLRSTQNSYLAYSGGCVGVGTTACTAGMKLDVQGDVAVNGNLNTYGNSGWYNRTHGGGFYMQDASWVRIYGGRSLYAAGGIIRTDGELQVGGNGADFRVNAAGNVGIGDPSPAYKLDVNGDMRVTGKIANSCRWVAYAYGGSTNCPAGWTVFTAGSGGIITGGLIPLTGSMLCCKTETY